MMYQSINASYEHYLLCDKFYSEYESINNYIIIVNEIRKKDIHHCSEKVKKSIKFLEEYFDQNGDVTLGKSLVTKLQIENYISHINILSNYVGKIDLHLLISNLIDKGFSIPKFVTSEFPVLHISNVWNPLINPKYRKTNSIVMNMLKPNVMIITGPNKAGKSTFMRSVILSVYLSQSIGIACCDEITLTMFRDIFTYINIPDCVGRESLFEAEINRCYKYIENTESLKGFSIGIIDELFTGTNPREGMAASYAILNRIADNPTNITILSTHFHDIIESLDKNKFLFNMFTAKTINNKFIFDYKIEMGVSNQCIALQLLKERGFSPDIIDNALKYINNI